jgi:perosamine synthetase
MKNVCTISQDSSVLDAMATMEQQGARWGCVVTNSNKVSGVITHGDIRRFILAGGEISSACSLAANTDFFYLPKGSSPTEIAKSLESYDFVPILDPDSRVLHDVATSKSLHSIPILEPNLGEIELSKLNETFLSGWISSKSPTVTAFERGLEEFTALPNIIAVSNGTVAIHLALSALGVGHGDEVIVPDLTFAATANAVIHAGATPVLVDVEGESLGLNYEIVEASITEKTRAIILVHLYGMAARDYEKIAALCTRRGLLLIEDCAEALGTTRGGSHVGSLGDAATFSFFGNKLITTGEGGAIAFRDAGVMEHAKILRDHGQSLSERYLHEFVGFNYRMTGLQAAIGLGQLERIEELLLRKRTIADAYRNRIANTSQYFWLEELNSGESSYWLNVFVTNGLSFGLRTVSQALIEEVAKAGVELRPLFKPMHQMPPYKNYKFSKLLGVARSTYFYENAVCVPSGTTLSSQDIKTVCGDLILALSMSKELGSNARP